VVGAAVADGEGRGRSSDANRADFTYIWTAEGWLYVSAVIDLFSRRVVGWSMGAGMTAQLVADALLMAVWRAANRTRCCITRIRAASTQANSG